VEGDRVATTRCARREDRPAQRSARLPGRRAALSLRPPRDRLQDHGHRDRPPPSLVAMTFAEELPEDEFGHLLVWAYRGEVSGEALFDALADARPEHADGLRVLAELERDM